MHRHTYLNSHWLISRQYSFCRFEQEIRFGLKCPRVSWRLSKVPKVMSDSMSRRWSCRLLNHLKFGNCELSFYFYCSEVNVERMFELFWAKEGHFGPFGANFGLSRAISVVLNRLLRFGPLVSTSAACFDWARFCRFGPLVLSWADIVDLGHLCRFGTRFYFSKPKGEKFEEENSPIFKNGHEL